MYIRRNFNTETLCEIMISQCFIQAHVSIPESRFLEVDRSAKILETLAVSSSEVNLNTVVRVLIFTVTVCRTATAPWSGTVHDHTKPVK